MPATVNYPERIARARREIEAIEAQIRGGNPDVQNANERGCTLESERRCNTVREDRRFSRDQSVPGLAFRANGGDNDEDEDWEDEEEQKKSSVKVFLSESIRSWSATASLFPSSRALAASLVRSIDFSSAHAIVELGVGTGAITSEILQRMGPDARVYTLDINPIFIAHIKQKFKDPRLVPILGDARHLATIFRALNVRRVDAVVSSLSLTWMEKNTRLSLFHQITGRLSGQGVFTQYQYLHARVIPPWCSRIGISSFDSAKFLRRYFQAVSAQTVLWNLPPAVVYTCQFVSR